MTEVLVADDHAVVRRGLRAIIDDTRDLRVAAEADSGDAVVALVRKRSFDVLVMDLSMPGVSGFDLIRLVKAERPAMPVLVISVHGEKQYALRVLRAGASGYLPKETAPDRLVEALRLVVRGGRHVSPEVAEIMLRELMEGPADRPHARLSEREFQVMHLLAGGVSVTEIADRLALSVKTVSTYRARVLEKMHLRTNADLTQYALREGLIV